MSDYRVVWLRDRISKALGVQEHPETIEELFREHNERFQEFVDDEINEVSDLEKCILYIYRTFYDKLVEREVLTIEKGTRHESLAENRKCLPFFRYPFQCREL
jgi:dynein heavy chain